MLLKLLGASLIGIGTSMVIKLKKENGFFDFKSRKGKIIAAIFVIGIISIFVPSNKGKDIDYLSIAAPDNAPWDVELTKTEAKKRNKNSHESKKTFFKEIDLDKADITLLYNTGNEINIIGSVSGELGNIAVALFDESGQGYDINKKDAKIMLKYVQRVEKQMSESANYLNHNFDNADFVDYAYDAIEARKGLEKALKVVIDGGSDYEIDEIIADDFYYYAVDSFSYFITGNAYIELLEAMNADN